MSQDAAAAPNRSIIERHLQTGLQAILVALVLWACATIQSTQVGLARAAVQLENISLQVTRLQEQTTDQYTTSQARVDRAQIDVRIDRIEDRLQALERPHD